VLWPKIQRRRPTCQAGQPCNLAGRSSFLLELPLGIGYLEHRLCWTCRQNGFLEMRQRSCSKGRSVFSCSQGELVLCATSFPHVIFSVTMLILDIMKICMNFGRYGVFISSDVPKMVDQQNSWNLLVISTYLLYHE
jgi:hypothetical protein